MRAPGRRRGRRAGVACRRRRPPQPALPCDARDDHARGAGVECVLDRGRAVVAQADERREARRGRRRRRSSGRRQGRAGRALRRRRARRTRTPPSTSQVASCGVATKQPIRNSPRAQTSADPLDASSVGAWVELGRGRARVAELLDDHVARGPRAARARNRESRGPGRRRSVQGPSGSTRRSRARR